MSPIVDQGTPAQQKQRAAFIRAHSYCKVENSADKPKNWLDRCTSYNIHRALKDLPMAHPPDDYQIPKL